MCKARFTEHQLITLIKSVGLDKLLRMSTWRPVSLIPQWTISVLHVMNLVWSCCLNLSGIRNTNLCPKG